MSFTIGSMQIYADLTGCTMHIADSARTCAPGSAISSAGRTRSRAGGHADFRVCSALLAGPKGRQNLGQDLPWLDVVGPLGRIRGVRIREEQTFACLASS